MATSTHWRIALPLGLFVLACDADLTRPPAPPPPVIPAGLQRITGNNQEGKTWTWLATPFVVRATDAFDNPVHGAHVTWQVEGEGEVAATGLAGSGSQSITTVTNQFGETHVWFRSRTLGKNTVTATALSVPPVRFTADVTTLVLPWWGEFLGPDGLQRDVAIPSGIAVEWASWTGLYLRIRSTSAPAGGEAFDTGRYIDTPFRFVPGVTGTWDYVVEYLDNPGYEEKYSLTVVATGSATPKVEPAAIPAPLATGGGAWIIREDQDCFLPGIDANGLPFPVSAPCKLQLVLTGNDGGKASGSVQAQVPNASGRAVRLTFGPLSPFPCFFQFDTDGDGLIDVFKQTTDYTLVVSASGQLHMSCHFPG